MKKFILTVAFTTIIIAGKLNAQTVYVTENGKKYHAKNCDLAKTGKKGITLDEAKKGHYDPCKHCKAEAITPQEKKTMDKDKDKPKAK
ncbi:MAG: hypothetical protein QM534_12490 [Sediminibacterium sp.]|nr:hypothetical protein [Sediminibacterium sp.]